MGWKQAIGVVGAGTMGNGIAHVAARSGLRVVLTDVTEAALERGMATIRRNLAREVAKGRLTEAEADEARSSITLTTKLDDLGGCGLAIEAATEQFPVKAKVFRELDRILPDEAVLASNTSSISITRLAAVTGRPEQVIGMHFFNPVPVMKLVEVIRGLQTSQATFDRVQALAVEMGKTPVEVNDAAGFVSNRVLMPMLNEAMFAVMEGVATAEAVDQVFQLGMAHPMGPLTLADFIGLDVCLDIMRVLVEGLGDPKYRPCPLLVRMVDAGMAGAEVGAGLLFVCCQELRWMVPDPAGREGMRETPQPSRGSGVAQDGAPGFALASQGVGRIEVGFKAFASAGRLRVGAWASRHSREF